MTDDDERALRRVAEMGLLTLIEIAAYDDERACRILQRTGGYHGFPEPAAVQKARGTLHALGRASTREHDQSLQRVG